ncbi:energy-coupling factor transporter transmembrane component T [Propionivibrio limicola]|uniref:energy-coupling factor transporter transmembrane component T n=1 Tax=Propionivibrio limicola TaxID=167645 RepID=UPI0014787A64|nr:energy-coupling factor transporter transmembrane component T [Propionivibrio limicola]
MPISDLHPATRLFVWLMLLLAIQGLGNFALVGCALLVPLMGGSVLRRGGRLIWRTRWLIVSLLAVFAWGRAGEHVWVGPLSPTYEGLSEAITHGGRLVLLLMAVGAFLETTPLPVLLSGGRVLLAPFRQLGCDPDRSVVRLMLVLRYVEALPRPRDWRNLLDAPPPTECDVLEVDHESLRFTDRLVMVMAAAIVVYFLFR